MTSHRFVSSRLLLITLAGATALAACSRQQDDELGVSRRPDTSVADAQISASQAAAVSARVASDLAITAQVNAALGADDQLKATQINVDTRDGQVTLSGQAPDADTRERAATLATGVQGVKLVNNQLVVMRNG